MSERRCDVELLRPKTTGPWMAKGVRVNGYSLPQVRKAEVIAEAGSVTILCVEMVVTTVKDVEVQATNDRPPVCRPGEDCEICDERRTGGG